MIDPRLKQLLQKHYGLDDFVIERQLPTSGSRLAYLISNGTAQMVLKITDPGRAEDIVRGDTGVLTYLERFNFPASRMICTRDGSLYLPIDDRFFYLFTYLPGGAPVVKTENYARLGELLARLHSIPIESDARVSLHRPLYLMEEVREYMRLAPDTAEQQAMADEVLRMIDGLPSFDGLPEGLVHTDPYFSNLVQSPGGELWLIDWEDAGISFPLMDVGYIGHLMTFLPNDRRLWNVHGEGQVVVREDYAQVFLDAYQSVRRLTALEKELFHPAVRLNFLEYIWEWGERRIIPENLTRLKLVESFCPRW